jgi:hypothetical protein
VLSVLALAVRLRLGGAPDHPGSRAWGAAARRVALAAILINGVFGVPDIPVALWVSGAVPALPSPPPELVSDPSPGQWVLLSAGLVWLAAYLALLYGHPRAATGLAVVGLTQHALLYLGGVLINGGPVEVAAAAAVNVVVLALLLLGLAAFHRDTPPPRRRPWLTALGVGLVLSPTLPVLAFRAPPHALIDPDAVSCLLVVVAATVYLIRRAVRPGGDPAWPLALAVLATAALTLRLTSLWAFTHVDPALNRLGATPVGLAQAGAALAAATALGIVGARDLRLSRRSGRRTSRA